MARKAWTAEERIQHVVESIRDYAVFFVSPEGRIESWNRGAELLKGYTAADAIGRHISMFYSPEDRAAGRLDKLLAKARADGRVEDEGWRYRKDGTRFWADVVITALYDDDGELRGYAKVTRDLTDRRAAQEELRRSEECFRMMVESVRDYAIFMLDPAGRVATWNAGAQRIKGWAPAEIVGQHFSRFYERHDVEAGKCEH